MDSADRRSGHRHAWPEQQDRLAQDTDGVFNAKSLSMTQFDQTIADVQAIPEVGMRQARHCRQRAADLKSRRHAKCGALNGTSVSGFKSNA